MPVTITFHGHSTVTLDSGSTKVLIDPFFSGNPSATVGAGDIACDAICCTHAHDDHVADLVPIAKRTGATVFANYELAMHAVSQGVENYEPMNPGGKVKTPWGWVAMTPAIHSASFNGVAMGVAAGIVVHIGGVTVYHLGDTALFSDLKLMSDLYRPDVALIPVGDRFTMGPEHGKIAAEWIRPKVAIPIHYGTWPLLTSDISAFRPDGVEVKALKPGESMTFGE